MHRTSVAVIDEYSIFQITVFLDVAQKPPGQASSAEQNIPKPGQAHGKGKRKARLCRATLNKKKKKGIVQRKNKREKERNFA